MGKEVFGKSLIPSPHSFAVKLVLPKNRVCSLYFYLFIFDQDGSSLMPAGFL